MTWSNIPPDSLRREALNNPIKKIGLKPGLAKEFLMAFF
jgi:hypothetical protein